MSSTILTAIIELARAVSSSAPELLARAARNRQPCPLARREARPRRPRRAVGDCSAMYSIQRCVYARTHLAVVFVILNNREYRILSTNGYVPTAFGAKPDRAYRTWTARPTSATLSARLAWMPFGSPPVARAARCRRPRCEAAVSWTSLSQENAERSPVSASYCETIPMPIPTEPIGSIPRPPELIRAFTEKDARPRPAAPLRARSGPIARSSHGSRVVTDGEHRSTTTLAVPGHGSPIPSPTGSDPVRGRPPRGCPG